MTDEPEKLHDVAPADFIQSPAHVLRFNGRRWAGDAGEFTGQMAAERLYEALTRYGYSIKKKPPAQDHRAPAPRIPMK